MALFSSKHLLQLLAIILLILSATFSIAAPLPSPHHAIQVGAFFSAEGAEKTLFLLRKHVPRQFHAETRIERGPSYYFVRVGRFESYGAANGHLGKIRKAFPDAFILQAPWQENQILKRLAAPAAKAPVAKAPVAKAPVAKAPVAKAPVAKAPAAKTPAAKAPAAKAPAAKAPAAKASAAKKTVAQMAAPAKAEIETPREEEGESSAGHAAAEKSLKAPKSASTSTGGDWWRYGGPGIVLLALAALGLRLGRRKPPTSPLLGVAGTEELRTPPALSREWEILLQKNQRELSGAEGNLLQAGKDVKTIYVTSCFHGEGKTTAAVNLALALAENSNKWVLLVDGNSDAPQLHALFGTRLSPGLSDISLQVSDPATLLRDTKYPNLTLMTCGERRERQDMVEHHTRLDGLREMFDYILVDGHSALGGSQLSLVARHYDGVLLAVQCERTKWQVVQQVREKIEQVEGKVLGVILNKRKFYIPRFFYGRK